MPSSRPTRRRRVERRQARAARRARLVALLVVLAAVFVVALAPHRFRRPDDDADVGHRPAPEPGHRRADAADHRDRRAARAGAAAAPDLAEPPDRDRLPLRRRRRAVPPAGRAPGERGPRAASRARHLRRRRRLAEVVPAGRRRARRRSTSARRSAATSTRRSTGRSSAIRPFVVEGKTYGSEIDIQPQNAPSLVVAVTQLVADPALDGRHAGRQRRDEARPGRRPRDRSSNRRSRATRTTPGTT